MTSPARPRGDRGPGQWLGIGLGIDQGAGATGLAEHDLAHGPMPSLPAAVLLSELERSGLTGRGGAAFPAHRKLAAVAAGPKPRVVVANGAEGEPASNKDKTLLATAPHLVLDGLQLAARIVDADRAFVYLHADLRLLAVVEHALRERRAAGRDAVAVQVVCAPPTFVAGEESAVASCIDGGAAVPRPKPPRVFEAGVSGRPTLVQNVETLAHIALICRRGADAFRTVGDPAQPGTMLFTVTGGVRRPGVVEAPVGTVLADVVEAAGGSTHHVGAVLLGGYHGAWVDWPRARELPLANASLRPHGLSVGAGVVVVLPADVCGVNESARVLDYLATQSARQCGPCVFGLPQVAATFADLAGGSRSRRKGRRLRELAATLERRGGCHHPDGSIRFLRSATAVFAAELAEHAHGRCGATSHAPVLPTPAFRG